MEKDKLASVSSTSQETTTDRSRSPEGSYAFLAHSQDSVSQSTLLDIDNKHNVRQKRRRTRYFLPDIKENKCLFTDRFCSPEDHAILEAEYQRNSKPDKAARNDIVNRVSLGEKEVQVSENEEHSSRNIHTARQHGAPQADPWYLDMVPEPSSNDTSQVEATATA